MGAPHSGKSTFVQNTGLKAILTTQDPSGFPASNNNPPCEWWINDHALLIDTAGRFTVQDSNTSVSNKTWLKLLVALKKARPNCPLNGAILTISADDLLTRTATYITHQAQSIRRRIQELNNHLGMTLPIYVVITKCDALAGFRTFHSTLSAEASQKPLGFSLPGTGAESTIFQHKIKYLEQSFAQFTRALSAQVLSKIKTEPLQSRRDRIVQFPQQLAFLHETILDLMVQVFSPSTLEESANWRGLYFVSALHVNRESRLAANLLTVNGMSNPVETVNVEPKPFFIQDLIRSRIATESHLAHFNRSAQKNLKGLYTMAIGIAIVSFAAVLFIWMKNYQSQLTLIQNVQTHITDYKQSTWDGLNVESDWTSLASGLTKLRDLPAGYGQENNRTWYNALGLYHTQKLKNQATQAYLQALHQFFFRKLNAMLLAELNDKRQTDDDLYEALKFYLMLYHPSNMDQEAFRAWVHRLWQKHLPAENQDIYLVALNQHLQVLCDKNIPAPLMDQQRVSEARATLRATPLARRIYRRIVEDGLRQPGTLSVVSVLGPQANAIFTRKSGKPLSEGIPTLFTYKHFHSKYLLKKTALSASLHADQWIYGDVSSHTESTDVENNKRQNDKKAAQDVDVNSKPMALSQAIDDLYFADYIKYWDNYLQDLTLHPVNNAAALDNVLSALNATNRPLTHWLNTVRQHLALHRLPQADALNTLTEATDSSQLQKVARLRSLAPNNLTETASLPGKIVSDHFAGWVGYINAEPGQAFARLDTLISDLHAYWTELNTSVDFSESA
ncbi:MAG: type VI secretion system membrane subunit TssM, partial [Gammaproteobacteria bacterium]